MGARTADSTLDHKHATLGVLETDDEHGAFTTLVSVTGLLDHDGDIIEPGAYARTLAAITPKGVWSHDWNVWTARTEHIEELLPGDARLPAALPDGRPWPADAGALLVKGLCNLATQAGKDMYANLQFFRDQVQWSIGYKVRTSRRSKGARRITDLDLYEYSPVLFGANPYTSTLDLKAGSGTKARGLLREAEVELAPLAGTLEERIDAITAAVQQRLLPADRDELLGGTLQIVGTYPDRVIASVWKYSEDRFGANTWEVPYVLDGDGLVTAGQPRSVRLVLDVEGGAGADAAVGPLVPELDRVASHIKTLSVVESKEGRALSGANAGRLAAAVRQLVAVLDAAGINWQEQETPDEGEKGLAATLLPSEIGAALALFADARDTAA
ncbi:HK97 family phage prohead protease [Kitasatospora purpeofusca]|uniref:HK97 family phage prohead protease n=1 Tax=Kitasatospora purpeofusca TaxID=67352 RepID=UPI002E0D2A9C|nr:HK97 family phage prohead protease [Kitasatospora purpeofusca]WSR43253.1 HK97 family phage prohead protease [Kitasatospora purpeofusca]